MTAPSATDGSIYQAAASQGTDPAVMLQSFWLHASSDIRKMTAEDFRTSELPLARIKKIMKMDEDVKMISAEAPVLFAKAAEIFVAELTLRAWIHTEDNKRRTLQRNDIAMAITKYDQFDFLIDIVPREELKPQKSNEPNAPKASMYPEQVQYYFQLAQPQNQSGQGTSSANGAQSGLQVSQIIQQQQQQQQQNLNAVSVQPQQQQITLASSGSETQNQPVIQLQQSQQNTPQVFHQVVNASGEVQNIPIQLSAAQLQAIQAQMQGKQTGQTAVIQAGGDSAAAQVHFVQQPGAVFQLSQQQFLSQDSSSSQEKSQDGDENDQLTIMAEVSKS